MVYFAAAIHGVMNRIIELWRNKMSVPANKDVVRAFMAAQTNGDYAEARLLLREDVIFHVPVSAEKVLDIPSLTRGADRYIETRRDTVEKLYKSHARNIEV